MCAYGRAGVRCVCGGGQDEVCVCACVVIQSAWVCVMTAEASLPSSSSPEMFQSFLIQRLMVYLSLCQQLLNDSQTLLL